jgi:hypothetical protein
LCRRVAPRHGPPAVRFRTGLGQTAYGILPASRRLQSMPEAKTIYLLLAFSLAIKFTCSTEKNYGF